MKQLLLLLTISLIYSTAWASFPDTLPAGSVNITKKKARVYDQLVDYAKKYIGTPYKLGGATLAGFDCSGYVLHVYTQFGVSLPRTSKEQSKAGKWRCKRRPKKGDLLFFRGQKGRKVGHVGIVISEKGEPIQFIHASSSRGVVISDLSTKYFKKRYKKARKFKQLKKKVKN